MPIKRPKNWYIIRLPRTRAIRALHNIYVINTLSKNTLSEFKSSLKGKGRARLPFEIPSVDGEKIVSLRRRSKIHKLLKETIDRDLYKQSLIAAVAITESYLVKVAKQVLRWYPQKLSSADKKIDFELVVESQDIDELLNKIIDRHVNSIFYATPVHYLKYIEQILSINIDETIQSNYAEIKATRDVLVHNDGIVNELYLRKADICARATIKDKIPIDSNYFSESITCMKGLITSIYEQMLQKYGDIPLPSTKKT